MTPEERMRDLFEHFWFIVADLKICAILDCEMPKMAAFMVNLSCQDKSLSKIADALLPHISAAQSTCINDGLIHT